MYNLGVRMNFNHLMEKRTLLRRCAKKYHKECYWRPMNPIRATTGKHVCITMYCKYCDKREDIFLSEKQYKIQEKIILREIESV